MAGLSFQTSHTVYFLDSSFLVFSFFSEFFWLYFYNWQPGKNQVNDVWKKSIFIILNNVIVLVQYAVKMQISQQTYANEDFVLKAGWLNFTKLVASYSTYCERRSRYSSVCMIAYVLDLSWTALLWLSLKLCINIILSVSMKFNTL